MLDTFNSVRLFQSSHSIEQGAGMATKWFETANLFPAVLRSFRKTEVVLDIGCGIMPQQFVRPSVHICCEPFQEYISHLQDKVRYESDRSYVIVNATWAEAVRIFPPKSVDSVFLVDVIEHLEKEEAVALLKKTEQIARKQVALFTPLGFMPQSHPDGKDAWGLGGGVWQEHKSGWQPEDFDASWDIYAAKEFHAADSLGRKLDTPYGALWAIKNLDEAVTAGGACVPEKKRMLKIMEIHPDIKLPGIVNFFVDIKINATRNTEKVLKFFSRSSGE